MHFYFRHTLYGSSNAVLESRHIRGMVVVAARGRSAKKMLPVSFLPQLSTWQVSKPETWCWILRNSNIKVSSTEGKKKKTRYAPNKWHLGKTRNIYAAHECLLFEVESLQQPRQRAPESGGQTVILWALAERSLMQVSFISPLCLSLFAQTIIPGKLGKSNSDDNGKKKKLPKWLPEFAVTTGSS